MNFRDTPGSYLRTPRTSRSAALDACALTRPDQSTGHRWVPLACVLAGLFVVCLIALEKFA